MKDDSILRFDPMVCPVDGEYQILFTTATDGIGWIEIDGERYTTEEVGILKYGRIHKVPVDGAALEAAGHYTVVFVEYKEKPTYYPKGEEKVRRTYRFYPVQGNNFRLFQYADTHAAEEEPLACARRFAEANGGIDLLVMNGDINNSSDTIECFDTTYRLAGETVHGERPVILSRGNHDTRGLAAEKLADYTPTAFRNGKRETYWTFRQGGLWGLVLDCGEDKHDDGIEYGGTVFFDIFRRRETKYFETLIENAATEFDAPGVTTRIAICHNPVPEYYKYPFDVASEVYDTWVRLLEKMHIDLMICGHIHDTYCIPPHNLRNTDPAYARALETFVGRKDGCIASRACRDADFPVLVSSRPPKDFGDGRGPVYTGGAVIVQDGHREADVVVGGEITERFPF